MKYMHWSSADLDQCYYDDYLAIIEMIQEENQAAEERAAQRH